MAQRGGMLPKFRPATSNGRESGAARPVIRPVKPTAPPPPPSPPSPRRRQHAQFDDETEGRIETMVPRTAPLAHRLDAPFDSLPSLDADHLPATEAYHEPVRQPERSAPILRGRHEDSGPRRRPERYDDVYEEDGVETHYRETDSRHAALAYCRTELHEEISPAAVQAMVHAAHGHDPRSDETNAPRRRHRPDSHERSIPRQLRERKREAREMPAVQGPITGPPRREERLREVPPGFVVGVQPLRTVPQPMPVEAMRAAATPAIGIAHVAHPPPAPATVGASPRALPRPQTAYTGPHQPVRRVPTHGSRPPYGVSGHHSRPQEYEDAEQSSKVGRFAWFVFGAAFGIFFAFFATSFVGRVKKDEAPPAPVMQPPPIVVQAPIPQPVQAIAPQAPVQPVATPPVATQPAVPIATPPAVVQPQPAPQPSVAPRAAAPRPVVRARPQVRRAARDDEERSPAASKEAPPKEKSEAASDLLNAGIGP
jgi:hypothetical protein